MTTAYQPAEVGLLGNYAPNPVTFVTGRGSVLCDADGVEYLDALGGIACSAVGHCHPDVTAAIAEQAGRLVQTSMLFWNEPVVALAAKLRDMTGWGRMFFANSGAEANECAFKLVRKWAGLGRHEIICAWGGFSGRTLATLAATGQPAKWEGFEPLPEGFRHAEFNNLDAFRAAITPATCAIFVEPIQGENGVLPADPAFLAGLRALCDEYGLALIFDEIQTGMGRTGSWWAWQDYGVEPDVFTSAKALANGLPIGACIARDPVADAFVVGDHGSTFGGSPVPAAAAVATIGVLERENVLASVPAKSARLREGLERIARVRATRGRGLLLAAVLDDDRSKDVVAAALRHGLVANNVAPDAVRFVPPLTVSDDEIDEMLRRFAAAVEEVFA